MTVFELARQLAHSARLATSEAAPDAMLRTLAETGCTFCQKPGPEPLVADREIAPAPRELITINQACVVAQVSQRTMYLWIQKGKVQVTRTAGGHPRIVAASLWQTAS